MLTDAQCRTATCPPDKARARLTDAAGLYLEVSPSGRKRWFMKVYREGGSETRLALGSYPAVGLKAARQARDAAKALKAEGIDPVKAKLQAKALPEGQQTFEQIAREWYSKKSPGWSSHHQTRELRNLEKDLFPGIGVQPIEALSVTDLLAQLRRIEERGSLDVAHRVLGTARGVWAYAVATGRAQRNIANDLKGALTPHRGRHFAAVTDPAKLGQLLRLLRSYKGGYATKAALLLAPMLFQRPTELRAARWAEFDLDGALWTIPAARMKRSQQEKLNGDPHYVPLPTQAVRILRQLHSLTGQGELLFPGVKARAIPISENTLRAALLTLGIGPEVQSVHGFRATARTLLAERLEFEPHLIEAQLAHAVRDANGRAYNRTTYLQQRRAMMQAWADYLDRLTAEAPDTGPNL